MIPTANLSAATLCLVLTGCGPGVTTQVVLQIDADAATVERARSIRLTFFPTDDAPETLTEPLQGADARLAFPITQPLSPRDGDATRTFKVLAELLDVGGDVFQAQRAIGAFEADVRRHVYLRFEASCDNIVGCGSEGSCAERACVAACVDPVAFDPDANRTPYRDCADQGGDPVPLARYRINEADTGQIPLELIDDSPSPIALPLVYAANSPVFDQDESGNRFLRFSGTPGEETGGARLDAAGTELASLHGTRRATLEIKYTVDACSDTDYRVFGLSNGSTPATAGWLLVRENEGVEFLAARWSTFSAAATYRLETDCPFAEPRNPAVAHWVIDTERPVEEDRVRAYVDGERQIVTPFSAVAAVQSFPPQGATIDLVGDEVASPTLVLGTEADGSRTANIRVWYAAVYGIALTDTQIASQAAILALADD